MKKVQIATKEQVLGAIALLKTEKGARKFKEALRKAGLPVRD